MAKSTASKKSAPESVDVNFTRERETKNKVRYSEDGTEHIGTLYVSKETVESLGNPDALTVTITAA